MLIAKANQIKKLFYSCAFFFFGFLIINCHIYAAEPENLIESIKIDSNKLSVIINKQFKAAYLKDNFWVEYESDINLNKLDNSIVIMPFVLNVVPMVWLSGKEYVIDCLDEDLYYSLKKIKAILQRIYPKTRFTGELITKKLVKNRFGHKINPLEQTALLYSSGLDSTAASYALLQKQLLISIRSSYEIPNDANWIWEIRQKRFSEFAQQHGHINCYIKSNYIQFLNWNVLDNLSPEIHCWTTDVTEGMLMIGLAAPVLVSKGYPTLHMASTYTWYYPYPAAANPFIDDNLVFAGNFRLKHMHFDLSRIDKIALLVKRIEEKKCAIPYMKVCDCGDGAYNCNNCGKCLGTIISLAALGENPQAYGFDIASDAIAPTAKKFLAAKRTYWTRWNFLCLQKFIRQKLQNNEPVPDTICWLARIDLNVEVEDLYIKNKIIVNWQDFKDLAPQGLEIPDIDIMKLG